MRFISTLLLFLFIFSCNSESSILTEKEFAALYVDSLSVKHPDVKFEINGLTITSKKGDLNYTHYIDNAFLDYKADPAAIGDIISRYVASTADLYAAHQPVSIGQIVPVIKPVDYLDEINSLSKDGKSFPLITEKYNDRLIIAYAEDAENSIKYLTEDDFNSLNIRRDTLRSVALRNFDRIIPDIQRQGDNGVFLVTAGGNYEASLILLPSIWIRENFPVEGDFIVAIPNKDLLMVTGSKNKTGIERIKAVAAASYKNGSYQVSDRLYRWTGAKFEVYE